MGGENAPDTSRDGEEIAAIRLSIDLGMTHIDTAEMYGAGHAEELVGEAIKSYRRSDLFITTKVWHTHLKHDDLLSAMRGSLHRLDTDYVDLYLVHWPNPQVPLKETMETMEFCVDEGYTRLIGVSNFSVHLIEEARSHLKGCDLVADQVEYNLIEQGPMEELLPYCRRSNLTLIAYRPLGRGDLIKLTHPVLDEIAEKYSKTRAQVALNWLISQEGVVAIPKALRPGHLKDNLGAVGWRLSEEDFRRLTEVFRSERVPE